MGVRWLIVLLLLLLAAGAWLFAGGERTENVQEHVPLRPHEADAAEDDLANRSRLGERRDASMETTPRTPTPDPATSPSPAIVVLVGTILDEARRPVDDVDVRLEARDRRDVRTIRAAAGAFELANLTPGTWTLTASREGRRTHRRDLRLDGLRARETVVVVLQTAPGLALWLRTPEGRPLRSFVPPSRLHRSLWCAVTERDVSVETGARELAVLRRPWPQRILRWTPVDTGGAERPDAHLELHAEPPRTVTLLWDELVLDRRSWEGGDGAWEVTVDPARLEMAASALRFRVVSEEGDVRERSSAELVLPGAVRAHELRGEGGAFHAAELPAGPAELLVRARGAETIRLPVTLPVGGTLELGDLVLRAACAFEIDVRAPGVGEGALELAVTPRRAQDDGVVLRRHVALLAGPGGASASVRIEELAPGTYRVRSSGIGLAVAVRDVVVAPGARIAWALEPGVDVRLQAPVDGSVVHHVIVRDGTGTALLDEPLHGAELSSCLAPGEYEATWRRLGGADLDARFRVRAGEHLDVRPGGR